MLRLSMCVRNEEHRYLRRVLNAVAKYVSSAVIIDDASTDGTVRLCFDALKNIPSAKVISNTESKFKNEWELRRIQWDESVKGLTDGVDWLLFLDADEIFEDSFADGVSALIANEAFDLYSFRLYDFWNEDFYRDDALWCAHKFYRPFLLRYRENFPFEFNKTNQHCGRMPSNVYALPNAISEYRVKHYGWAKPEDRAEKFKRYTELDPTGKDGSMSQYLSIPDENPALTKWEE